MTEITYYHINLDYLNLMADGDADMKKTMLEMLLDELPSEVDKMVNLIISGDMTTLKAVSHKLKSTLAFVGNEVLDKTNKDIEAIAIEEKRFRDLPSLSKTLQDYCKLVVAELQVEFSKM